MDFSSWQFWVATILGYLFIWVVVCLLALRIQYRGYWKDFSSAPPGHKIDDMTFNAFWWGALWPLSPLVAFFYWLSGWALSDPPPAPPKLVEGKDWIEHYDAPKVEPVYYDWP